MKFAIVNGEIQQTPIQFSSKNRSFKYGDGLFETIKVVQGHPLFYRSHYSRLVRGLDAFGIEIPETFTFQYFLNRLQYLLNENTCYNGVIRVHAYRDGLGNYLSQEQTFSWIAELIVQTEESEFFNWQSEPYQVGIFTDVAKEPSTISPFKTSNSLPYVLAANFAKKNNFQNAVLLNHSQHVVETISENIFLFQEGTVITPPIADGPIDGIMRSMIKKLCKWNGIDYLEETIPLQRLRDAEELFLTNSINGIIPVTKFHDKEYRTEFCKGLHFKLNERVSTLLQHAKR